MTGRHPGWHGPTRGHRLERRAAGRGTERPRVAVAGGTHGTSAVTDPAAVLSC